MSYFRPTKYLKDESRDPIYKASDKKFATRSRGYSYVALVVGFFVLGTQVIFPLITFTTKSEISKPVASSVLGVASGFREFEFEELSGGVADINAPEYFYVTIPKLEIENAKVETNPGDLDPSLALGRYPGSSLPGESGNTFIYGHSVLPVFYNPENYKTIFSTLGQLETGDVFIIAYNNRSFEYVVETKQDLKPSDVNPLADIKPAYLNESTVTLMTCSPPGTKLRRLLVNATLRD